MVLQLHILQLCKHRYCKTNNNAVLIFNFVLLITYFIHIWQSQPFGQNVSQYSCCVCCFYTCGRVLQFDVRTTVWKLFHDNFVLSQSSYQQSGENKLMKEFISQFFLSLDIIGRWSLLLNNDSLESNLYILNHTEARAGEFFIDRPSFIIFNEETDSVVSV